MPLSTWFSPNPDKAWVEKFFLLYSPIWMALIGVTMVMNWHNSLSDIQLIVLCSIVVLPIVLVPMLVAKKHTQKPWYDSYWFKANVYLFVFGFFGNYFGSEYFFDVLGMVYNFNNATTRLDSSLLGSGTQTVPIIMYILTHAYFMTYHVTGNIALRKLTQLVKPGVALLILFPVFVFIIGYAWAWAETKAMANPMMAGTFFYEKMDIMLAYGSMIYATYFLASFPLYYFLDETPDKTWSIWVVIGAGMSASMLTFYMLDIASHWVGSL